MQQDAGPDRLAALYSTTSLEGLDRPWDKLAGLVGSLDVQTRCMGAIYIANGVRGKRLYRVPTSERAHE